MFIDVLNAVESLRAIALRFNDWLLLEARKGSTKIEIEGGLVTMARRNYRHRPGRRAGLFIGGVMFGLVRGIFFKNKY